MKNNLDDFIVKFDNNSADRLIGDWIWLIGNDKTPILVSAIGDLFLRDDKNNIFWLNVGEGKLNLVANGNEEFEGKLKDVDQVNEWFMIDLIEELKNSGQELNERQIYSYKKLPVLGGDYSADNFEVTDIEVHFCFAGQIHEQVKDLPPGTKIGKVNFNKSDS
jgi:hypothetical protein